MARPALLAAAGLLAALAQGCGSRQACPRFPSGPGIRLALHTADGRSYSLAAHRGRVTVVTFLASWCLPCQLLVQRLLRVRAALGKERVALVAVAMDTDRRLARQFARESHYPFPVLLGEPRLLRDAGLGWVRTVPTTLVLDARGRIRAAFAGVPPSRRLAALLRCLLADKGAQVRAGS